MDTFVKGIIRGEERHVISSIVLGTAYGYIRKLRYGSRTEVVANRAMTCAKARARNYYEAGAEADRGGQKQNKKGLTCDANFRRWEMPYMHGKTD